MDLPSMSRVTKLPMDKLKELSKTTPVFAPGLDHLEQLGAVAEIWDPQKPLDEQLEEALKKASPVDTRDELGATRKGRPMAAKVAKRVIEEATGRGGGDVASAPTLVRESAVRRSAFPFSFCQRQHPKANQPTVGCSQKSQVVSVCLDRATDVSMHHLSFLGPEKVWSCVLTEIRQHRLSRQT